MGCVVKGKIRMFRAKKEDNVDTGRHKFEKRRGKGVIHDTHSRESSRKENHKTKERKGQREGERESMEDGERNQSRTR